MGLSLIEQGWRPFAPQFEDDSSALARLAKLAARPEADRLREIDQELSRLKPANAPQQRYQAAAMILRDLTKMGWLVCVDHGQIYIRPHEAQGLGTQPSKAAIRRQLVFARDDQLTDEATRFTMAASSPWQPLHLDRYVISSATFQTGETVWRTKR